MARTVFDVLTDEYNEKIDQLKEFLASGGAKSFDEYRSMCGEIKGLFTALSRMQDLQRKMETQDE